MHQSFRGYGAKMYGISLSLPPYHVAPSVQFVESDEKDGINQSGKRVRGEDAAGGNNVRQVGHVDFLPMELMTSPQDEMELATTGDVQMEDCLWGDRSRLWVRLNYEYVTISPLSCWQTFSAGVIVIVCGSSTRCGATTAAKMISATVRVRSTNGGCVARHFLFVTGTLQKLNMSFRREVRLPVSQVRITYFPKPQHVYIHLVIPDSGIQWLCWSRQSNAD